MKKPFNGRDMLNIIKYKVFNILIQKNVKYSYILTYVR